MARANVFRNEGDLRKHVGDRVKLFRIEAQIGGTVGLPDMFWRCGEATMFVETKVADVRKDAIAFAVRPDQRRTLTEMVFAGFAVIMLVAIKGSRDLVAVHINQKTLMGVLSKDELNTEEWACWIDADSPHVIDSINAHCLRSVKRK